MNEPNRQSRCPFSGKCGGCELIDIPYEQQLHQKTETIRKLIGKYSPVQNITGAENPFHYRNKVHAVFGRSKNGSVISGIYQEGTHRIVPVTECLIEDQTADRIIDSIRKLVISFKIPVYDEDARRGCIRHVLIRTAHVTGQVMVVLVTGSSVFPSRKNFVQALRVLHPEITTIVQNINGKKTSMILGDKESVLFGRGSIEDELCGLRFQISSGSFFQVNPLQTQKLYQTAIELAGISKTDTVIDAYCGIGTIGMICASKAGRVVGVESNASAVRDAAANARRNHIDNIRFVKADAGDFMVKMAAAKEQADVVIMDPPRSGSTEQFLDALGKLAPERVVYISCNPHSLAADLRILTRKGYHVLTAQPVDMFPQTGHVECIVLLTRNT